MFLMDILRQEVDALRIVVATHEGDTGDVLAVLFDEGIDGITIGKKAEKRALRKKALQEVRKKEEEYEQRWDSLSCSIGF